jgi:hypothetical protein
VLGGNNGKDCGGRVCPDTANRPPSHEPVVVRANALEGALHGEESSADADVEAAVVEVQVSSAEPESLLLVDPDTSPLTDFEAVNPQLLEQEAQNRCVVIKNLRKEFHTPDGVKVAVKDLSMSMYEGQIFALLGHNGAGKTTTISMLSGMLEPTSGDATILGNSMRTDMHVVRHMLGVCPQHDVVSHMLGSFNAIIIRPAIFYFSPHLLYLHLHHHLHHLHHHHLHHHHLHHLHHHSTTTSTTTSTTSTSYTLR